MGLTRINNNPVVAPTAEMTVRDLKRLAGISELERLYELDSGRVLNDTEVIDTNETEFGATLDWERGGLAERRA